MNYKEYLDRLSCERGWGGYIHFLERDIFSYAKNTKQYADFQQKIFLDSLIKLSNFGYYIKTENYKGFIAKIARDVYDLEHRKLRKRKLRGRKLRGHSVYQMLLLCVQSSKMETQSKIFHIFTHFSIQYNKWISEQRSKKSPQPFEKL